MQMGEPTLMMTDNAVSPRVRALAARITARAARWVLAVVVLSVSGASLEAQPPRDPRDPLERSVDRALDFLRLMQEPDGSWASQGYPNVALSGLATLAFLSAGHLPGEGPYGDALARGVDWLLTQQHPNGVLASDAGVEMYHHGITTLALTQLLGMTDSKRAGLLRTRVEKAVALILKAQVKIPGGSEGGWRYTVDSTSSDLSLTSWQVMALRGARNAGCDVPIEPLQKAIKYVESCRDPVSGGYCYVTGYPPSPGCTGVALLVQELVGKDYHRSREALQAGSFILKNPPQRDDGHFFYSIYYSTQGMFQLGNNYWNAFRPVMHKLLLGTQNRNGSWIGSDGIGPIYSTSMAVLALTVEYRLLPIYQREEDPEGK